MKRFTVLSFVLVLAVVGSTAIAGQVILPPGKWKAKLTDFGAWYVGAQVIPPGAAPVVGFEDRSIFHIDGIYPRAGGLPEWVPGVEELTGLFYDVYIGAWAVNPADGRVTIDFVPGGTPIPGVPPARITRPDLVGPPGPPGSGGAVDVWLDQSPDWCTSPGAPHSGPWAWLMAGMLPPHGAMMHDDYPGASDLDPTGVFIEPGVVDWMYGTFVPLPAAALLPGVAVLEMTVDPVRGTGHGSAFVNLQGGTAAGMFMLGPEPGLWPPGADMSIEFDLEFPPKIQPGELLGWSVRSEDPVLLETIPEPMTLLLLGSGVLGAVGYLRRRRAA